MSDNTDEHFDLFQYFQGKTRAWGIFEDRFGKLRRSFEVSIVGKIQGDILQLEEVFFYNDGEESERVWNIKRHSPDTYSGTAADINNIAKGHVQANNFVWKYKMSLPISGKKIEFSFEDTLYALNKNNLFNRAIVSKWGITLGSISLFFTNDSL